MSSKFALDTASTCAPLPSDALQIPKTIWQIWFTDTPIPARYEEWHESWERLHAGWDVRLVTHGDDLENQDLYDRASELAPGFEAQFRSDILRLELLYRWGGLYVDMDFEPRKPVDPILGGVALCAVWERDGVWIANGLMGATAGHPFIRSLIDALPDSVARRAPTRPARMSGPQFLTSMWRRQQPDGVLFPSRWFIPYAYNELERATEDFPDALAVHRWNNQLRLRGLPIP